MAFPDDILLPANAKKFGFVDTKYQYNAHWDITWSFSFALTGSEHGFVTFLTTNPNLSTTYAGQFLGYSGYNIYSNNNSSHTLSSLSNGVLAIAFDSTGLFALPYINNDGVDISEIKKNSLIIREFDSSVVLNESLSSLSTNFFLASSQKSYQTVRFRFSNAGKKLSIDLKNSLSEYETLTSIPIRYNLDEFEKVYIGFCFCSPISSLNNPSTLFLKNVHSHGNTENPTVETITSSTLSSLIPTTYTTISGISAYPPLF